MVSLKKVSKDQEVTPVHLMDEEEAVRTHCPPKADNTSTVDVDDCKNKANGLDKWDIIEAIIIAVALTAFLLFIGLFGGKFLSEGFQLAKDIAFG